MKERSKLPNEQGDTVREKAKKKERLKPRSMKKERVKRGIGKRRKKRTKRGRSKEDVRVLSLWRPWKSLVEE